MIPGPPERRAAAWCVAVLALACASPEPDRELHQWTDADGNVAYTAFPGRIPVTREHTRRVVEPGASAQQNATEPMSPPAPEPPPDAQPEPPPVSSEPPPQAAGARVEENVPPGALVEADLPAVAPVAPVPPVPQAPPAPAAAPAETLAANAAEASSPPLPSDLDARIAALEARVAADEETLKQMISDPAAVDGLRDSDSLREIAGRLPGLQADLEDLRRQRAQRDGAGDGDGDGDGSGNGSDVP
jgi:hypothetical protein